MLRARRHRRLLEAEPWRRRTVSYVEPVGAFGARGLVLLDDGGEHVLTVTATWLWTLHRSGLAEATEVDDP